MAERILSKGDALTVFDIDGAAVETVVCQGAVAANSAAAAAREVTITLLPSSVEVRQAVFGDDGALRNLRPGMTLADLSGTDPDCARELQERLSERQVTFIGGTIHASGAPAVAIPQCRTTNARADGANHRLSGLIGIVESMMRGMTLMPLSVNSILTLLLGLILSAAASADWKEDWEKTVGAAKQEGSVVIYTFPGQERLFQEFQKKFPGIKLVEVTVRGSERITRILSERRAEKYVPDFLIGGAGSATVGLLKNGVLDPIKPLLLLPEVLDQSKWWLGRHIYGDNEGNYIFSYGGAPLHYFHYNTKLVKPLEFKSYWDFLDPKWRGKIVIAEPLTSGTQEPLQFLYHHPEIGPDFVKRLLTEMDVTVSRDSRQIVDWLAQGRYAVAALQNANRLELWDAKKRGLAVDAFATDNFKEGSLVGPGGDNIMLINRAPHPNAARVFVNWLLSREGQIAFQKLVLGGRNSLRIDIPKDDVPEHARIVPGAKYVLGADPAYSDLETVRRFVGKVWKTRR
jgi:iron(III) transport system substrate-binding protein